MTSSYDDARRARPREVRSQTVSIRRMHKRVLALYREHGPDTSHERPRTRAECASVPRPCPYVGCAHNLYLDVTEIGSIRFNYPDLEPEQMVESCSLDLAARGGMNLESVGAVMNLVRERVRQLEDVALDKVAVAAAHLQEAL